MSAVADRAGTGSTLGEYDRLWSYLHSDEHTTCRLDARRQPGLHQTLHHFDRSISEPLLPLLYFAGVEAFATTNFSEPKAGQDALTAHVPGNAPGPNEDDPPAGVEPGPSRRGVAGEATGPRKPNTEQDAPPGPDAELEAAARALSVPAFRPQASSVRLVLDALSQFARPAARLRVEIAPSASSTAWRAAQLAAAAGASAALGPSAIEAVRAVAWQVALNDEAMRELARASRAAIEPARAAIALRLGLLADANGGAGNLAFDFIQRFAASSRDLDERLTELAGEQTTEAEALPSSGRRGSQQVLSVISEIAAALDLPEPDVAAAADISRSSYFNWKSNPQTRPQLAKVSRLWLLAQAVTNLRDVTGGRAAHWLHAEPSRRTRVLAGEFEAVFDEAWREQLEQDGSPAAAEARAERERTAAPSHAAGFPLGSDTAAGGSTSGSVVQRGRVRRARRTAPSISPGPAEGQ